MTFAKIVVYFCAEGCFYADSDGRGESKIKTYSVKEIATLLGTNQETVRRWIRDGKLQAVDNTKRKGANKVILESALESFLKTTPRFIGIVAGTGNLPASAAALGALGAVSAVKAAKEVELQALSNAMVSAESVYSFLASKIAEERAKLEELLAEREELDRKIQIESDILNRLIEQLRSLPETITNQHDNMNKG